MAKLARRTVDLPAQHEFRFELENNERISVTLLSGRAEVFGCELVPNEPHPFGFDCKAAVWTPEGCQLEIAGSCETSYVASESPLPTYLSLHLALSKWRVQARPSSTNNDFSMPDDEVSPPVCMLVGERGSGKTTLAKTLLNWRTRDALGSGKGPKGSMFVNADVSEGSLTMPGTLSLTLVNSLLTTTSPICAMGTSMSSGPPAEFPKKDGAMQGEEIEPSVDCYAPAMNPYVLWYGHTKPTANAVQYEGLLRKAGEMMRQRMQQDIEGWRAGSIIDTPGEWIEKKNQGMISKAVRELGVNVLCVVGNERQHVEMTKLMSTNKTVTVVRVPKSDGASEPDLSYQSKVRDGQIRAYFYGGPPFTQGVLSPFSIIVKFDDLRICRIGEAAETQAPSSALPIGSTRTIADTELVTLDLTAPKTTSEVMNRILAVPQAADDATDEEIVTSGVVGFVHLSAIDVAKKKVTLLSPLPGRLPRKTLLVGTLDWLDT